MTTTSFARFNWLVVACILALAGVVKLAPVFSVLGSEPLGTTRGALRAGIAVAEVCMAGALIVKRTRRAALASVLFASAGAGLMAAYLSLTGKLPSTCSCFGAMVDSRRFSIAMLGALVLLSLTALGDSPSGRVRDQTEPSPDRRELGTERGHPSP